MERLLRANPLPDVPEQGANQATGAGESRWTPSSGPIRKLSNPIDLHYSFSSASQASAWAWPVARPATSTIRLGLQALIGQLSSS